jgi:peptidoglycan/xylan/chitin deacetylase (PgdA/CDA1 family)
MGNSLTTKTRFLILGVLLISISISIVIFYPSTKKLLSSSFTVAYYEYNPKNPVKSQIDTSTLPPAEAVPVLIYHGVVKDWDNDNTKQERFIEQMEALKREGYETISIEEYDLFRQGKFTLPPKPIIITFDDGRKDSYYTTDDIFKKLGFKATMFAATGPTIEGNSFYLTWDEYRELKATGRWEIEAHGRDSHDVIPINKEGAYPDGPEGRYLLWRKYLSDKGRLETPEEFKKRVEADYINSINDLKRRLGVTPHYFAIPLNDFGQQKPTNYSQAPAFNHEMYAKYFRMAFIIVNDPYHVTILHSSPYNFKNTDPYRIARVEVKNMRAQDLITLLKREVPVPPALSFTPGNFTSEPFQEIVGARYNLSQEGLVLSSIEPNNSGIVTFGKTYWENYTYTVTLKRIQGRSAAALFHYVNNKNYMSFGITDKGYFLRSTVNDETKDLIDSVLMNSSSNEFTFSVTTSGSKATGKLNGAVVFKDIAIPLERGAVGAKIWDDTIKAESLIEKLQVGSL